MNARSFPCVAALVVTSGLATAQSGSYQPLGTWVDPQTAVIASWAERAQRPAVRASNGRSTNTRPTLSGQRLRSVELLEDALLRKHPRLLKNSPDRARQLILRRYNRAEGPLRGYMAEAMLIDRNPAWHYVSKPNATQHDVYRWLDSQRPPYTGQVKYHDSGEPQLYARDMVADHRSPRFFIPDDHVEPVKKYLLERAERASAIGDMAEARRLQRDYARLRPIRASSREIRGNTTEAARAVSREIHSTYVLIGAASALALGPILGDLAAGSVTANQAAYQAVHSLSLLGVGYGADQTLARLKGGALRGSARGNFIIGTAIAVAETTWLLHQHGWQQAFYQPDFYVEAVGGVSALGLGLAGGAVATSFAAGTGPFAPWIGFGSAVVTGSIGYWGGRAATYALLERVAPQLLLAREQWKFTDAKDVLDRRIQLLQTMH